MCATQSILDAPGYGFSGQDAVSNEDSSTDVSGVSDIDLDELLKGLNIGSPRKDKKTTAVEDKEPDEVRQALHLLLVSAIEEESVPISIIYPPLCLALA